jgi:tetratricopeptide (TPR) repeat protein
LASCIRQLKTELDETRLRQRALAQLMDFADQQGKRILLIVENLNMLFIEQLDNQNDWDLRHTLQTQPRLMLLGTATQRFDQIENIDKAWFEFFTLYELDPLQLEECRALWTVTTGEDIKDNYLKPMLILTGGNPRLLKLLADFSVDLSFKELMANLSQLIDEHTNYFKGHLDNLAAAERKVFVALLDIWDPASARDVANSTRMGVNQTSSLLNRLVSRGAVMVVNTPSRKKLYQASERLYNIYYLMRRRSHPTSRVRAVVSFMVIFYPREKVISPIVKLAMEACLIRQRQEHLWAYQEIIKQTTDLDLKVKILQATPSSFLRFIDLPEQLLTLADLQLDEKRLSLEKDIANYDKILSLKPNDPLVWHSRGQALYTLNRCEEAIDSFDKALMLKSDDSHIWSLRGESLRELNRDEEAIASFDKALELDPNNSFIFGFRGKALLHLNRDEEAVMNFDKALELNPNDSSIWYLRGVSLYDLDCKTESVASFDKALELDPNNAFVWHLRGKALFDLEHHEEAIASFDRAVSLDSNDFFTWYFRGVSLREIDCSQEAISSFDRALELDSNSSFAWLSRGVALHILDRDEEAVVSFDKALEIDSSDFLAWYFRGISLYNVDHLKEAIASFDKALDLNSNNPSVWYFRGMSLHSLNYNAEAIASFDKALEIDPNDSSVWCFRGISLMYLDRDKEAITSFDKALVEESAIEEITDFIIFRAASGYSGQVLKIVTALKASANLEPLIVGLRIFLNEQPLVAQEILEVGQDVAQRIREQQHFLEKTSRDPATEKTKLSISISDA